MGKKKVPAGTTSMASQKARDELYSHILRCGVIEALHEHQREWFDDTIEYFAERYPGLTTDELQELRRLGERYCQPVILHGSPVGATT